MTFPASLPSSTVMVAFLSWLLLMTSSQSPPLALDARAALHAPDHVIGQSIQQRAIEILQLQRRSLRHHRVRCHGTAARTPYLDDLGRGPRRAAPHQLRRTADRYTLRRLAFLRTISRGMGDRRSEPVEGSQLSRANARQPVDGV